MEVYNFKNSKTSSIYMSMLQGSLWEDWLWLMDCLNPYDLYKKEPAVAPGFIKIQDMGKWREWAKINPLEWKDSTVDVLNMVAELPPKLRTEVIQAFKTGDAARWFAEDHNMKDPTVQGNPKVSLSDALGELVRLPVEYCWSQLF